MGCPDVSNISLVSIRNYIALKLQQFQPRNPRKFSIHTKLHRSKTTSLRVLAEASLVSIRNYIALKLAMISLLGKPSLVSIRNYIALKHDLSLLVH